MEKASTKPRRQAIGTRIAPLSNKTLEQDERQAEEPGLLRPGPLRKVKEVRLVKRTVLVLSMEVLMAAMWVFLGGQAFAQADDPSYKCGIEDACEEDRVGDEEYTALPEPDNCSGNKKTRTTIRP